MDKTSKNKTLLQQTIAGMKAAFFLSLATNLYEVYKFLGDPGGLRQGLSVALGILGTFLIWQYGRQLRDERKQALLYWLLLAGVGLVRLVFVDAAFQLNLVSIVLLAFFAVMTQRTLAWTRDGLLT